MIYLLKYVNNKNVKYVLTWDHIYYVHTLIVYHSFVVDLLRALITLNIMFSHVVYVKCIKIYCTTLKHNII